MNESWDPFRSAVTTASTDAAALRSGPGGLQTATLARLRNELRQLINSPLPGIIVTPDEVHALRWHALITGPEDTPYANGFFYLVIQVEPDYPSSPPKVKIMTTGGGQVRFNPNLYANGKVCLSILGTWHGPGWSPSLSIGSVLLSIQSLMCDQPLRNEPGKETEQEGPVLQHYNDIIVHETLRVAVIDNVQRTGTDMPEELREAMLLAFSVRITAVASASSASLSLLEGVFWCTRLLSFSTGVCSRSHHALHPSTTSYYAIIIVAVPACFQELVETYEELCDSMSARLDGRSYQVGGPGSGCGHSAAGIPATARTRSPPPSTVFPPRARVFARRIS